MATSDSTVHPDLDSRLIDAIAGRLFDALSERLLDALRTDGRIDGAQSSAQWLDAAEVSRRLGVTREWVYGHASQLGAVRIGHGPRPRLRFPPAALQTEQAGRRGHDRGHAPRRSPSELMSVYEG